MPRTPLRYNCPICMEDCPSLFAFHPGRTGDARHGVCRGCTGKLKNPRCPMCRQSRDAPPAPKCNKRNRSPSNSPKKPKKLNMPQCPSIGFGKMSISKASFGTDWMVASPDQWSMRLERLLETRNFVKVLELRQSWNEDPIFSIAWNGLPSSLSDSYFIYVNETSVAPSTPPRTRRRSDSPPSPPRLRRSRPAGPPPLRRTTRQVNFGNTKRKIHTGERGGKYYISKGKKHYV